MDPINSPASFALISAAAKLEEMEVDVGCSSGELNELTLLGRHLSLQHAYGLGACPILFIALFACTPLALF